MDVEEPIPLQEQYEVELDWLARKTWQQDRSWRTSTMRWQHLLLQTWSSPR